MKILNQSIANKITWSDVQKKWICYDNLLIESILKSSNFKVTDYYLKDFQSRFSVALPFTEGVLENLPLAHEGHQHVELRRKMMFEIEKNSQKAVELFKEEFTGAITKINCELQTFDIAEILINSILKSNLALANIDPSYPFEYSDFTLILDETQSVKHRIERERKIKEFSDGLEAEEKMLKIAIVTVGVNALISSALNSIISVLSNKDFEHLKKRKFFCSTGIKSLERVCMSDAYVAGFLIKKGQSIKLMSVLHDENNNTELEINKKFFVSETTHACQGMSFSLRIWKQIVQVLATNFKDLHVSSFEFHNNDSIFAFPIELNLSFKLNNDTTTTNPYKNRI